MKKIVSVLAVIALAACVFIGCSKNDKASGAVSAGKASVGKAHEGEYHIGIMTGTLSQSEDDLRGAEELIRRYGSISDGGIIQHVTYPDDFMSQQETTILRIVALADDPLMKAIIMNQGVPGAAEAFRRVKERRPDIMCFVGEPQEDPRIIHKSVDLAVNSDFVSRGYTIVWAAKEMGANTFVHISFPRHMSVESLSLRRQIMEEACKVLGLKFVFETAPDPTSEVGVEGAQKFIMEHVPQWILRYGADTAFFCTNDAHTEPLLRQLAEFGGVFVEADLPSPLMGYPEAFDIDLTEEAGDFPAILKKVEDTVVQKAGPGKFGTWAFSYGFTVSAGLGEYAKRILDGKAELGKTADLYAALGEFTPGAKWNGGVYFDAKTGTRSNNHLLIYMDTYVMGQGYLPTTELEVPDLWILKLHKEYK